MKKTIAILLILALATFGLFAVVDNTKTDATILVNSVVAGYSAFGVSENEVIENGFRSIALFEDSVSSSVDKTVDMLLLGNYVDVGFLSGINNTATAVILGITIAPMVSGNDTVAMLVSPVSAEIAASASSRFGTLENIVIKVKEATEGTAVLAPAGDYSTTVTINLTSG